MTVHFHGLPITPLSVLYRLAGRHFCVSFARPEQVRRAHEIGQSVMLDNGAFSMWTSGKSVDWVAYYRWVDSWLCYPTTWAVIPDVIDGDAAANDRLISNWPHGSRGAPVWHMHEPIRRLCMLCESWPRVCVGSSGAYRSVGTARWHGRMTQAFNEMSRVFGRGHGWPWLHMLRGMSLAGGIYPFASLDSTDIARNHSAGKDAVAMAARWDAQQCPATWHPRSEQSDLLVRGGGAAP